MSKGRPKLIAIDYDDHHASHVWHTVDGRQFFLTAPFVPAYDAESSGSEFIAVASG